MEINPQQFIHSKVRATTVLGRTDPPAAADPTDPTCEDPEEGPRSPHSEGKEHEMPAE